MNPARVKFLGIYLIAICSLQICLYFIVSLYPKDFAVLASFAPHLGIYTLEKLFLPKGAAFGIFSWLTAGWILTLGILLFFGRPLLKTYIISEILFSLPSLLLFLVMFAVVLIYPKGFLSLPVHDVFFILGMVTTPFFSTIIPLVWAIWLAWRSHFRGE